jgi:hypothetical protein
MDRRDWYYRQKVLEDELDAAFDGSENADLNIVKDLGFGRDDSDPGVYGGISGSASSFDVTHLSGLDMYILSGASYRSDGKRVGTVSNYTVSVVRAGTVATGSGGAATGASTDPGVGYKRVVSIFIAFERKLDDPRYDGYNNLVYFKRDESFYFYLTVGAPKLITDPTAAVPPARESSKHLIVDVTIENVAGTVTYVSHDQSRREWQLNLRATNAPNKTITTGRIRTALKALLEFYNEHVNGNADRHPATAVDFTPAQLWADGTGGNFGSSSLVNTALNGIVYDIAKGSTVSGTQRMGARAQLGTLLVPTQASHLSLTQSTLDAQLKQIMDAVNGRVFRGGDNSIAGVLSPAVDGTALGTLALSWDAFIRDLTVKGVVKSNLVPSAAYNLGSSGSPWTNLFVANVYSDYAEVTGATFGDITVDNDANCNAILANLITTQQLKTLPVAGLVGNEASFAGTWKDSDGVPASFLSAGPANTTPSELLAMERYGIPRLGKWFIEQFNYVEGAAYTNTLSDWLPPQVWKNQSTAAADFSILFDNNAKYFALRSQAAWSVGYRACVSSGSIWHMPSAYYYDLTALVEVRLAALPSAGMELFIGFIYWDPGTGVPTERAGLVVTSSGIFARIETGPGLIFTGGVNLTSGSALKRFLIKFESDTMIHVRGETAEDTITAGSGSLNLGMCSIAADWKAVVGTSTEQTVLLKQFLVTDRDLGNRLY